MLLHASGRAADRWLRSTPHPIPAEPSRDRSAYDATQGSWCPLTRSGRMAAQRLLNKARGRQRRCVLAVAPDDLYTYRQSVLGNDCWNVDTWSSH